VAYDFLEEAEAKAGIYVDTGDNFDAVRYGWGAILGDDYCRKWRDRIQEVADRGNLRIVLIEGNHDWGMGKRGILKPPVEVYRSLSIPYWPLTYFLTHGWVEYDLSLGWLRPIYGKLFKHLPQFAWIYDKIFNSPSKLPKGDSPSPYWKFVIHMNALAELDSIENNRVILWGHSHNRGMADIEGHISGNAGTALEPDKYGLIWKDGKPEKWQH